MLQLRLADLVMLEIPLPESPPQGFDLVWDKLKRARAVFFQGGPFAWEGTAGAVRRALEHWEQIEPSKSAPGSAGRYPSKAERLFKLRQGLQNYMSYSLHPQTPTATGDHEWTRDDALLGITGLAALLAVRKP
jgi:hypothetical protein